MWKTDKTKMKESIFDWRYASRKYPTPCETATNIGYTFSSVATQDYNPDSSPSSLSILLTYTNKIKIISQSRLIDGQALVGYIGGYVGLFLGTIKIIQYTLSKYKTNLIQKICIMIPSILIYRLCCHSVS